MTGTRILIISCVLLALLAFSGICLADATGWPASQEKGSPFESQGVHSYIASAGNGTRAGTGIIANAMASSPAISVSTMKKASKNTVLSQYIVSRPAFVKNAPVSPSTRFNTRPAKNRNSTNMNTPVGDVVDANTRFGFDLFSRLADGKEASGENVFFSPLSISTAFALSYEGARGSTAGQIQSVLHFPVDNNTRRSEYSALIAGLNSASSGYTISLANALWAEKTYPFLPEYTRVADEYYSAKVANLDFIRQPDASRATINRWVEEHTNNKIKNLLPAGSISGNTRLVITNAIYFKGKWETPFSKDATYDETFQVSPQKSVQVPMMHADTSYNYTETGDVQMLELPYYHKSGKQLSMLVVLPKETSSLAKAEQSLSGNGLRDLEQSLSSQEVRVTFPKFRMETEYLLNGDLQSMGMMDAFDDNADFSGMDGTRNLVITKVIHKAFIEVNEEGTEAAAATAIVNELRAIMPSEIPVFKADHPFMFFIIDRDTGDVLFMGRVSNPATS